MRCQPVVPDWLVLQESPQIVKLGENPVEVKACMERDKLKWAMLVDDQNQFLGWVTYEDLREDKPIREIIQPAAVTAAPETPLNEALSMMLNSAIGNLAVLDEQKRLLGVLTFENIREVLGQAGSAQNGFGGKDR